MLRARYRARAACLYPAIPIFLYALLIVDKIMKRLVIVKKLQLKKGRKPWARKFWRMRKNFFFCTIR